jgi:hypothetical protein
VIPSLQSTSVLSGIVAHLGFWRKQVDPDRSSSGLVVVNLGGQLLDGRRKTRITPRLAWIAHDCLFWVGADFD